jgi:hypothetical protein
MRRFLMVWARFVERAFTAGVTTDVLLMETGDGLLLETGDGILIERVA